MYEHGYFIDKQAQVIEFRRRALQTHNRYRAWHGACALTINETLNRLAQAVADNLKYIDHLVHSNTRLPNGDSLGENLASSTGPLSGRLCTDLWYDEERYHNYAGEYTKPTGHFTQLVWKGSTQVGFGVATRGNYTVGVALYYKAGNVIGTFQKNVQPPIYKPVQHQPNLPPPQQQQSYDFGAAYQKLQQQQHVLSEPNFFNGGAAGGGYFDGGGGGGGGGGLFSNMMNSFQNQFSGYQF